MPTTPSDRKDVAPRNAATLQRDLTWFDMILNARLTNYFEQREWQLDEIAPPPIDDDDASAYAALVRAHRMTAAERLVLLLALVPHLRPQALDPLFTRNKAFDRGFTEFGGWPAKSHSGFLPTCETAAFIVAGTDLARRFDLVRLFENDHFFIREGILRIDAGERDETLFSGALRVSNEYLHLLTTGERQKPDFNANFPARLIATPLTRADLILPPSVLDEVATLQTWLASGQQTMEAWGLARSVKPGYRALFYGPPGTGKTLTATLLGQQAGVDVYRIDLSMVISKYIGETEKNLAGVFDQAANKNWILFFDEADALFGKRTETSSSNDRYANQEVSYLLQRIEDFPGVVILASNLRGNIDEAFARRFQSSIYFPMPEAEERLLLWRGVFGQACPLAPDVDLAALAEAYELAGGAIANIARHAALRVRQGGRSRIEAADLKAAVARELAKEGKIAS